MNHCGYITRIKNLRKHSNADRLQCGEVFGNSVIVGLDIQDNELGFYIPTDLKVSLVFATINELIRNKETNTGYLDPDKLNITTIKLRGEKSDGIFLPLSSLDSFYCSDKLKEGDTITTLRGVIICEKYIPRGKEKRQGTPKSTKKIYGPKTTYPLFKEHKDTTQLAYNLNQLKDGDEIVVTLKCHGSSGRTSNTLTDKTKHYNKYIYKLMNIFKIKPAITKEWKVVSGTRRTILNIFDGGFYGDNSFRFKYHNLLEDKLFKGETIYYEIVSWVNNSKLIMPECDNRRTKDKEFIKQYGNTTKFTYGCEKGESAIYVYRMTMTNEDGYIVEYPWDLVKQRCEQMNIAHVPELYRFTLSKEINNESYILALANLLADGPDPIGKTHIREGVVVRINNRTTFNAFKHKSFYFKVLEGIIKSDDILDREEAEGVINEV